VKDGEGEDMQLPLKFIGGNVPGLLENTIFQYLVLKAPNMLLQARATENRTPGRLGSALGTSLSRIRDRRRCESYWKSINLPKPSSKVAKYAKTSEGRREEDSRAW
jgi:hypothetical protein